MDFRKKRDRINSCITKCINSNNADDFYMYSAKLFFYVTTLIYELDFDRFHYIDKD